MGLVFTLVLLRILKYLEIPMHFMDLLIFLLANLFVKMYLVLVLQ